MFEVDLPEVFDFKEAVLAEQGASAAAERILVGVDLRDAWTGSLTAAGFDAAQPTAWLAEGQLPYRTMPENGRLLMTIGRWPADPLGRAGR